ncbi:hypothetical protein NDR87_32980 [Nocardia sp. CDC159]|uniref:Uncharacterized protein n=1 Tax=Nocardia pulmonis TaxID=2951408 RepID=A0A9X2ECK5_9NOCA|nr:MULTISPECIES: hypothetical protein [Nocardia]MCM6778407.1 hypothetical protein [Nocardia pulmonis]MCM6791197.1 hypothetical protein [Nocardia sp. CDC159]
MSDPQSERESNIPDAPEGDTRRESTEKPEISADSAPPDFEGAIEFTDE